MNPQEFVKGIQRSLRNELTPTAYTESVYKRWFQQLQKADAVLHQSQDTFIQMTMPEIKVAELPQPVFFKDHDSVTFLPKHIMEFMTNTKNATHWLKYSSGDRGIGGRMIHVHIVHYQRHAKDLIHDDASDRSNPRATNEESKGVELRWLKKYREYVYKIFAWFHFIAPYVKNFNTHGKMDKCECSKELNVYLYMTPFKKEFPARSSEVIGPTNSNTGFTTSCTANLSKNGGMNRTEIVIYRHEEFFKVLMHETMHNLELDFGHDAAYVSVKHLFPGIHHDIILSETYAETWARLLNVAFYCYYDVFGGAGSYSAYRVSVERCLLAERVFSLYQANRALQHMGLNLRQFLSDTSPDYKSLVLEKYDEDTNVFAYYVLAGLIMFEADLFMKWCKDTNKASLICANSGNAGTAALLVFTELIVAGSSSARRRRDAGLTTVTKIEKVAGTRTSRMTLW